MTRPRTGDAQRGGRYAAGRTPADATLDLPYRPPLDWPAALAHFAARAIAGLEWVDHTDGGTYWRTTTEAGAAGAAAVSHAPARPALRLTTCGLARAAADRAAARARRVFDLDADVGPIAAHLRRDPQLAPLVARRPGLRVPAGWDAFELGVRAVLGQQVSVAAARKLAAQLVACCGSPAALPASVPRPAREHLRYTFPTPAQLAAADLAPLGMPASRKRALRALAEAMLADPGLFDAPGSLEARVARLRAIPGVGEWTAQYIALRAMREPDAFPAADAKLLRAGMALGADGAAALRARSEAWRPWRAYAAQHLWPADPAPAPAPARDA